MSNDGSKSLLYFVLALLIVVVAIPVGLSLKLRIMHEKNVRLVREERELLEANATPKPTPKPTLKPTPTPDPATLEIPIVGMAEKNINRTKHPKSFRKTTESYVNKKHYTYYSDANAVRDIPCTVALQCINGIVTEVNDYRDNPKQIIHFKSDSNKSSGSKKKDNYWEDAEEFYYDHIEDFEDLDEAEEYYNDHYR